VLPATPGGLPAITRLSGPFGYALTIDVEEWYHTCLVPDYVEPERRPQLPRELDRLLPELLALLARHGHTATFFTLGEVAAELPGRVREIASAGHEVACHGYHHLRADHLSPARFRAQLAAAQALLEDVTGTAVRGFRAPEWSLRWPGNERLRAVAELGFAYDSSLAPCLGSGRRSNPRFASRLRWPDGTEVVELPPLTFAGGWQLPAGGWPGRLAGPTVVGSAARRHQAAGGLPVLVAHPWELAARPTPGELTGLARWVHELGRHGFRSAFTTLLAALPWESVAAALARHQAAEPRAAVAAEPAGERQPVSAVG
jgi:polysaccharide deacetylase family protein (PEP-CTERM system associated)